MKISATGLSLNADGHDWFAAYGNHLAKAVWIRQLGLHNVLPSLLHAGAVPHRFIEP